MSADQKQLEIKLWCKWDKSVYLKDETTMINVYDGRSHALGEYQHVFKNFLKDEVKDGKTLYIDTISGKKRDELVRWHYYNMNRFNISFYSDSSHYQTLFFMQKGNEFHILQSFDKNHKIVVSHCYHKNADKKFLRYCQYVSKETKLYRYILKIWYIYKSPNSVFNYNPTIYDFYLPKKLPVQIPFKLMM